MSASPRRTGADGYSSSRALTGPGDAAHTDVLALEVCHLFFDDQVPKKDIAQRLAISRFRVARLLEQARASGLVRIEYRERDLIDRDLSKLLSELYKLRLCVVVNAGARTDREIRGSVGAAAASLVAELIGPGDVVGLGWGRSLAAMVESLPGEAKPDVDVVQLAGGSARTAFGIDPSELARRFAHRLGGRLHVIHAPAFVRTREIRDALLREADVAGTVALFDRITLAVLGVGSLTIPGDEEPASTLSIAGALPADELKNIVAEGAVGELMLHPFDGEGRFVTDPIGDRRVAISTDQLMRTPRVLAVACGVAKGPAIQGALRSGVASMLVTDDAAARWLLANAPGVTRKG
jgi:DNA-binding transcriptional regulator LsrR (DeoR family)